MNERMILAIPSNGRGGLEGERSEHFGHCDCFTVVEVIDGRIESVETVENPPHQHGGCMQSVGLLTSRGVNTLVVAGMGARPLAAFQAAGITVLFENETPSVGATVDLVANGVLEVMDARRTGQGHH